MSHQLQPIGPTQSGLLAPKDVRSLKLVKTSGGKLLIVGINDEPIQESRIQTNQE